MVLGRDGTGADHLPAQSCVAGETWIHLSAFSATYSQARRGPGSGGWISEPAILDLYESVCSAVVDHRTGGLFVGPAVSLAGLDVINPACALSCGSGTRVLRGGGVSDADGHGRGRGGALGFIAAEGAAEGGRSCFLFGSFGVWALHSCDHCS